MPSADIFGKAARLDARYDLQFDVPFPRIFKAADLLEEGHVFSKFPKSSHHIFVFSAVEICHKFSILNMPRHRGILSPAASP